MTIRRVTEMLMLVGIVGYIAWDIFADFAGPKATISEITIHSLWSHPGLALIVGALLGHLTWPQGVAWPWKVELPLALGTGLLCAVLDLTHVLPPMLPVGPFLLGYVVGHWVWPQGEATAEEAVS